MAQSLRQICRKTSSAAVLIAQLINTSDQEEKKETILTIANLTLQNPSVTFLDDVVAVMDDPAVQNAVTNVLYRNRQRSNAKDQQHMQQQQILPPGGLSIHEEMIMQDIDTDTDIEQPGECIPDEKKEEIAEGYIRVITNENNDNIEIEEEIDKDVIEGIEPPQQVSSAASAAAPEPLIISEHIKLKSISRILLDSLENRLQLAFDWFCGMFNSKFSHKLLKSTNPNNNNQNNNGSNPNNNDGDDTPEYVNMVIFVGMVSILLMTAKVYHPRIAIEMTAKLTLLFQ